MIPNKRYEPFIGTSEIPISLKKLIKVGFSVSKAAERSTIRTIRDFSLQRMHEEYCLKY